MEKITFEIEEDLIERAFANIHFNRVEENESSIVLWYTYDEGEDYVLEVDKIEDEVGLLIAANRFGVSVSHSKIMEIVEEIENYKLNDDVEWVQKCI